jgi:thiol-disulfide isomerase/thioredoxin
MRLSLLPAAVLLASAALLAGRAEAAGPAIGDLAPVALGESGGKPVLLTDYRGRFVVVTFWNASCEPCKAQMAAFEELNKASSPQDLRVIGVDIGDSAKDYGSLLRMVRRPTMVMAHDEGLAVGQAWGVSMLPNVWLVDPEGRLAAHREDYVGADLPGILAEIRGLVAARQAPAAPAPAPAGGSPR